MVGYTDSLATINYNFKFLLICRCESLLLFYSWNIVLSENFHFKKLQKEDFVYNYTYFKEDTYSLTL